MPRDVCIVAHMLVVTAIAMAVYTDNFHLARVAVDFPIATLIASACSLLHIVSVEDLARFVGSRRSVYCCTQVDVPRIHNSDFKLCQF